MYGQIQLLFLAVTMQAHCMDPSSTLEPLSERSSPSRSASTSVRPSGDGSISMQQAGEQADDDDLVRMVDLVGSMHALEALLEA